MMKVAIVSENFKGSGILVLQWQRYNSSIFQHPETNVKISIIPTFTLSKQKCYIFESI